MKKYVKTIIIVSVLAIMCIVYFFYLSNRKSTKDATDKSVANQEVAALTTKDIDKNYPESPKEVVKLYARITKAYYKASLTDEQIEEYGIKKIGDNLLDDGMILWNNTNEMLLSVKLDAPAPCRLDAPDLDLICYASADCLHQHLQVI